MFAGTPAFALPALRALLAADGVELVGVLTQPDRRAGRGRELRAGAVKRFAPGCDPAPPILPFESLRGEVE
ncbi:MAG: methionyl-tRNA formyltransferase, partial [bacterium]